MADGLLNKASIILTPTGYKAGTLYNVAPVVEPYEDFDFARASVASRVNSSGLVEMVGRTLGTNLIDPLDFTNWINSGSTDITSNSFTTSGSGRGVYYQLTTNNLYKINVTGVSGDISLRYRDGGGAGTILGDFDTDLYFDTTGLSSPNIYLRANSATTATVSSVNIQEIIDTNNIPRISYDSNGDNGHILLEPTSTNLITYSEDFSQSAWQKSNITLTPNSITSPDGTLNAYKLTKPTSSQPRLFELSVYPTIGIHTFTSFYKNLDGDSVLIRLDANGNTANCNVDLTTNTLVNSGANIISSNITQLSDGWIRVSVTANILSTSWVLDAANLFDLSVGSSVYMWGAQLEALPYATSYIPTLTGSTETRATETATGAGSADLINSTEGVLYAEIAGLVDADASDRVISLSDNSITNRVEMKLSSSGSIKGRFDSASSDITLTETGLTASDFNKIALVWSSGKCALFINGVKEQEDLTFNTFASDVLFDLSFDSAYLGGSSNFYGKCKALAVFNEALSDDELNNLTG